ncbi:MAG: hypothetical protein J5608_02790 [Alphaproteobacteria bacterium]|nr:hypothetical protein [Alphaproteobacteria bacterium]
MNKLQQQIPSNMEKFHNAEQMWFWFVYSKSVQSRFSNNRPAGSKHICELLDVETMVTKLYLSGQLTTEQLQVMKKFGDKRRAPHQYIWAENHAAYLWKSAMDTLENAARKKGWLD